MLLSVGFLVCVSQFCSICCLIIFQLGLNHFFLLDGFTNLTALWVSSLKMFDRSAVAASTPSCAIFSGVIRKDLLLHVMLLLQRFPKYFRLFFPNTFLTVLFCLSSLVFGILCWILVLESTCPHL